MKHKVLRPVEIDVATLKITLPVRYNEEDMALHFPLRTGDVWQAVIDIDTGKIHDWPMGQEGEFYMKVVDEGIYELFDPSGLRVAIIEGNYVPHGLVPGNYGDYVSLSINGHGVITNWPTKPQLKAFFPEESAND